MREEYTSTLDDKKLVELLEKRDLDFKILKVVNIGVICVIIFVLILLFR